MSDTREPSEWLPPSVDAPASKHPVPICRECGGLVRRDLSDALSRWTCDLHGAVVPRWVEQ